MAGWERLRWVDRVVRRNNPVLTGQEGSSLIITVNHVLIFLPRRTQFLMRRGMGGGVEGRKSRLFRPVSSWMIHAMNDNSPCIIFWVMKEWVFSCFHEDDGQTVSVWDNHNQWIRFYGVWLRANHRCSHRISLWKNQTVMCIQPTLKFLESRKWFPWETSLERNQYVYVAILVCQL